MKLSNITFPHPVLGLYKTGNPDSEDNDIQGRFEVKTTIEQADVLVINNTFKLRQARDLEALVHSGVLAFACEITCSKTFFRKIYLTDKDLQTIEIGFSELRECVNFEFFILALKPFEYAYSRMWHDDYKGLSFPIETGMPIAYGGGLQYMVERVSNDSGSSVSLIEVRAHERKSVAIDFNHGSLTVLIPIELFPTFQVAAHSKRYDSMIHASIVVPALMAALPHLARNESTYVEQRWFQCLKTKLENDAGLRALDPEVDSFEIAQIISKLPFTDLINNIYREIEVVD